MPLFLPKHVAALGALASHPTDTARFSMAGVRIERSDDEWWRLVATDGRRLAIVQGPNTPHLPTGELLKGAPDEIEGDVIVPIREWKQAFKLAQKEQPVGLCAQGNAIFLGAGTSTLQAQQLEGRYPDYRLVLPRRAPLVEVRLDAELLASLCKVAAAVAREEDGKARLTLLWYGQDQPLGLMAKGEDGLTFDALLMPLS